MFLKFLCLLSAARACTPPHIQTDGHEWRISVDMRMASVPTTLQENAVIAANMLLYVKGAIWARTPGHPSFYVINDENEFPDIWEVTWSQPLPLNAWTTVVAEKRASEVCISVGGAAMECSQSHLSAAEFRMRAPIFYTFPPTDLGVTNFTQVAAVRNQWIESESSTQTLWTLVGVSNGVSNPPRDDYADASDPAVGDYVKAKYGNFTRLRYECGYKLDGLQASIELSGKWSWQPGGFLVAEEPATLVASDAFQDPVLPGYLDTNATVFWNDAGSVASFGISGFQAVDNRVSAFGDIFACNRAGSGGDGSFSWPGSGQAGDTRFVRLWLGARGDFTTTTTTPMLAMPENYYTCTETTTDTTTTLTGTTSTQSTTSTSSGTVTRTESTSSTSSGTSSTSSSSVTSSSSSSTSISTSTSSVTSTSTSSATATSATTTGTSTSSTSTSRTRTSTSLTGTSSSSTSVSSTSTRTATTSTASSTSSSGGAITTTSSSSSTSDSGTSSTATRAESSSPPLPSSTDVETTTSASMDASSTESTTDLAATTSSTTVSTTTAAPTAALRATTSGGGKIPVLPSTTTRPVTLKKTVAPTITSVPTLLDYVAPTESSVLEVLLMNTSLSPVWGKVPDADAVAFHVTSAGARIHLSVSGTDAEVVVPPSILERLKLPEAAVVATIFNMDILSQVGPVAPSMGINLNLYTMEGRKVPVSGLTDPVLLSLPTQRSEELTCAYWGEAQAEWLTDGLTGRALKDEDGERLLCATTHFTFFASVIKGFLDAFLCAQLPLLSAEGFRELFMGSWGLSPLAVIYWLILLTLSVLMLLACRLDRKDAQRWCDEYFLIEESDASSPPPVMLWTRKSMGSTFWQATEEIKERWYADLGMARDVLDFMWESTRPSECRKCCSCSERRSGRFAKMSRAALDSLATKSLLRQAAASSGFSLEMIAFLLEDQVLKEVLMQAAEQYTGSPTTLKERRLQFWQDRHEATMKHVNRHWQNPALRCSLPAALSRVFRTAHPLVVPFRSCVLWTKAQRVLLLSCELLGTFMLASAFFKASGGLSGKANERKGCLPTSNWGEEMGQIIAVGMASLVIATAPVHALSTLRVRSFRKVDYMGSAQWHRQLWSWRIQDKIFWVVGLLYVAFCVTFCCLCLANVVSQDHSPFALAGAASLAEDLLFFPLSSALFLPMASSAALAVASRLTGASRSLLLQEWRLDKETGPGNWYQVMLTI